MSFEQALQWQQRGELAQADAVCAALLHTQPTHADAWHLRGLLACQQRRFEHAVAWIGESLRLQPQQPAAYANLGNALLELRRTEEALAQFDTALTLQPRSPLARYGRGCALMAQRQFEAALADFEQALRADPQLQPALIGRGRALHELGYWQQALNCFDRILDQAPTHAEGLFYRANVLFEQRRYEEALSAYDGAWQAGRQTLEVLNNRGNTLRELHRYEQALECYQAALAIAPDHAESLCNRANLHLDLDQLPQALVGYEAALQSCPTLPEALENRGLALMMAERAHEATDCYAELLRVAPRHPLAASSLLNARLSSCDWRAVRSDLAAVVSAVEDGRPEHPFALLSLSDAPDLQLRCARTFAARWPTRMQSIPQPHHGRAQGRIRVAYVSADLREHAVAMLLIGVLEHHDRRGYESLGVALRPGDESLLGRRVRSAFDQFIDASRSSERAIAEQLRAQQVDIAIDLSGFTRWGRPGIFAHRAAPVQVNYLGYAGTLGAPYMDYILADEVVIPQGQEAHYSEQVVRLPHCYLPNDDRREIAERPSRSIVGLPEDALVLCAFTNTYKINPPMYEVWMRLLRELPESVLWLRAVGEPARGNLLREAQRRGVEPERLIFAEHVSSMSEHLARQALADLYLDTVPYNAHSTACDALWAGVPVLSCAGRSFASRVAASALHAVGLAELVTESLQQYERVALELGRDRPRLAALRARLAAHRLSAPLFDTRSYTRALESALHHMHQRARLGLPPAGFNVADSTSDGDPLRAGESA